MISTHEQSIVGKKRECCWN